MRRLLTIGLLLLFSMSAHAVIETRTFDDPVQEQRFKALIDELRCLVCQNQNLADSNADLAKDLREQTYQMIVSGRSDAEIVDYMVARYGDFVLYRPPFKSTTLPLWIGPFVLLLLGVLGLVIVIRRRNRTQETALSDSERAQVRRLLDRGN